MRADQAFLLINQSVWLVSAVFISIFRLCYRAVLLNASFWAFA